MSKPKQDRAQELAKTVWNPATERWVLNPELQLTDDVLTICGISPSDGQYEIVKSEVNSLLRKVTDRAIGLAVTAVVERFIEIISEHQSGYRKSRETDGRYGFVVAALGNLLGDIREPINHAEALAEIERKAIERVECVCNSVRASNGMEWQFPSPLCPRCKALKALQPKEAEDGS